MKLHIDYCKKKEMEGMEGKKTAPMQRSEGANVKKAQMIIRSKIRAMGAEVKPANTEGGRQSQHWKTNRRHTPGWTHSRTQEIVETMPIPTK